jgi:monothiol glutaredoxin
MNNKFEQIKQYIAENDVVLFMKGTASRPMCGFSATVANILSKLEISFKDVDVMADQEIREDIKKFSDWPTIPQLYLKGEFVGGCDIVKEMYESGDLMSLLKEKNILMA